jgi:hypothetical protein
MFTSPFQKSPLAAAGIAARRKFAVRDGLPSAVRHAQPLRASFGGIGSD